MDEDTTGTNANPDTNTINHHNVASLLFILVINILITYFSSPNHKLVAGRRLIDISRD
jgi:hypothetical protein